MLLFLPKALNGVLEVLCGVSFPITSTHHHHIVCLTLLDVEYNPTQLDYNWTLYSTPDWGTTRIEQMHGVFGIALVSDVLFVGKVCCLFVVVMQR